MRAALCQLASSEDLEANRAAAVAAVERAAQGGSDLVVLPEAVQRDFGPPGAPLTDVAEPLDGPFVSALAEAASRHQVTVVAGMFEAVPASSRVHNTLAIVSKEGLVARYRKLHLYDALGWRESKQVIPGDPALDASVVVPVADHRVGVMTCYDARFPEVARMLVDAGATVVVVAAAWVAGPGKAEQWRVVLQARALENTVYVVAADQPAPRYTGLSMAVDPRGHVMAALDESSAGQVLVDLPLEAVTATRRALPLLESRRFSLTPAR